jgi:hypothetical protein
MHLYLFSVCMSDSANSISVYMSHTISDHMDRASRLEKLILNACICAGSLWNLILLICGNAYV